MNKHPGRFNLSDICDQIIRLLGCCLVYSHHWAKFQSFEYSKTALILPQTSGAMGSSKQHSKNSSLWPSVIFIFDCEVDGLVEWIHLDIHLCL